MAFIQKITHLTLLQSKINKYWMDKNKYFKSFRKLQLHSAIFSKTEEKVNITHN